MSNNKVHPAWLLFIGLCLYNFVAYGLIVNTGGMFLAPICKDLKMTYTAFSIVTTIRATIGGLTVGLAGRLLPKVNAKIYFSFISLILGASYLLQSTFDSLWQFMALAVIHGFCLGLGIYATMQLIIPQWFTKPSKYLGIAAAMSGIGGMLFSPAVGWFIQNYSWRTAYIFQGVLALAVMLPISIFIMRYKPADIGAKPYGYEEASVSANTEKSAQSDQAFGITQKDALTLPVFYVLLIYFILVPLLSGVFHHVPAALFAKGFTPIMVGTIVLFYQLGVAGGQFLMGFVNNRIGITATSIIYAVLTAAGCFALVVTKSPVLNILAAAVFLIGCGRAFSTVQGAVIVKTVFGMKEYSKIFSAYHMIVVTITAFIVTFMGYLYDVTGSYDAVFTIIGICVVIIGIVVAIVMAMHRNMQKKANVSA